MADDIVEEVDLHLVRKFQEFLDAVDVLLLVFISTFWGVSLTDNGTRRGEATMSKRWS